MCTEDCSAQSGVSIEDGPVSLTKGWTPLPNLEPLLVHCWIHTSLPFSICTNMRKVLLSIYNHLPFFQASWAFFSFIRKRCTVTRSTQIISDTRIRITVLFDFPLEASNSAEQKGAYHKILQPFSRIYWCAKQPFWSA